MQNVDKLAMKKHPIFIIFENLSFSYEHLKFILPNFLSSQGLISQHEHYIFTGHSASISQLSRKITYLEIDHNNVLMPGTMAKNSLAFDIHLNNYFDQHLYAIICVFV